MQGSRHRYPPSSRFPMYKCNLFKCDGAWGTSSTFADHLVRHDTLMTSTTFLQLWSPCHVTTIVCFWVPLSLHPLRTSYMKCPSARSTSSPTFSTSGSASSQRKPSSRLPRPSSRPLRRNARGMICNAQELYLKYSITVVRGL